MPMVPSFRRPARYPPPMNFLTTGPDDAKTSYLFAHGAGGAMDHPFMNEVAGLLGERGIRVVRFEFPYMAARRHGGKRSAPDREPVLLQSWRDAVEAQRSSARRLVIGGKSMGGRMASMVADELKVAGLVCLGYPFHPPNQPAKVRTAHLAALRTPALIVQGTRDPFGSPDEVATYQLSPSIRVYWVEGGDHSLKPRVAAGVTPAQALAAVAEEITKFVRRL